MNRPFAALLCAAALAGLSGCGSAKKEDGAAPVKAEASSATLAATLGDAPGMSTVAGALKTTGLAAVFDGSAPYTLLAPDDDAFGAFGDATATLKAPENGAVMAAILKAHVLPGYVTVADVDAAIARNKGKPVKMKTMAGGEVTFAREGDALTVTAADGETAKVDGKEFAASNGVAIPIDKVLKKVPKSDG